jgi:NADPH:quinone reductase-like Zn-dependent oxidoreductase
MRAAIVPAHGAVPEVGERREPQPAAGEAVLELSAAALNPADLAIASGSFPAGSPPVPYVPGIEGVGRVLTSRRFSPGTRVWASGRGLGVVYDGALAERFVAKDDVLVEVPEGADDVIAAALGQVGLAAWIPLTWLAPVRSGEVVLVLGATGSVGHVAVQVAKLRGARRVVAVGRDEARLEIARQAGADVAVGLEGEDFKGRLAAAVEDAAPTLVLDLLWGTALEAAVAVAAPGARIAHVGQSAGPTAVLASGLVRGKQLQILGYSNFAVPADTLAHAYAAVVRHAMAADIRLSTEALPLTSVAQAWERQRHGRDVKLVIRPGAAL